MKKVYIILLSLIITLSFLLPYSIAEKGRDERDINKSRTVALDRADDISQKIIEKLNQSFEYVEILEMIMKVDSANLENMEEYINIILEKHSTIANIAIAPDGIIKNVYPLEGNEEASGHNLMEDPKRYPFIKKAIEEKRTITQGPVEAVQGGSLIFNRKPIFQGEGTEEQFWGFIAVAVDFEELMKYAGVTRNDPYYYYTLRAVGSNVEDDFIWGDIDKYHGDHLNKTINIDTQVWELNIYPKHGWIEAENIFMHLGFIDILYITLSLFLFVFICRHLNQYFENSIKARIDPMTGALNRNSFLSRVAKNLKLRPDDTQAMIILDINDFKLINDTYGHSFGDFVIVELSKRLEKILRTEDSLARWGGDEFVIYLNELKEELAIDNIIERIHQVVGLPFQKDNIEINIEVAAGYALFPIDGDNFDDLYNQADKTMYLNKPIRT